MSEKAPSVNREEIKDIVNVDSNGRAHGNKGEFLPLSDENIKMIAANQEKIRDGVAERQAQSGSNTDAEESYSDRLKNQVGDHRTDGPLLDESERLRQSLDGSEGDAEESYSDRLKNQVGDHRTDGPLLDESERLRGKLGISEQTPIDGAEVTSSEAVDAAVDGSGTSEDDPFARIREAVSNRIDELKDGGMSESEAFGQAHDEFYGADFHKDGDPEDPSDKPSGEEPNHPGYEGPVTPGMEIEPWQKPGELVRLPEVDPDLTEQLEFATSRYAEATAKSRKSYIGRFLKTDTKVGGILEKIPGVKSIVSGWNKLKKSKGAQAVSKGIDSRFEAETLEAKTEYEKHYTRLAEATAKALEDVGWDAETVEQLSLIGNIQQDAKLEDEIVEQRESQGKDTNKFVNWWVNAKGIKGKLKKAAVVVAAGAATGLTGGLFLGATAAMIAGGAAGASIGVHVTRRRANSVNSEGITLAQEQSNADRENKNVNIHVSHGRRMDGSMMTQDGNPVFDASERVGSVEDITGRTEERTDEEMVGNRRRVRTATALGAAAGKGAFKIKQLFDKPPTDAPKPPKEPGPRTPKPHDPTEAPQPTPPEAPVRGLENFNVENGNGITHELMDFAEANGHQITPEQANHLYENLLSRLGPDNILSTRTYVRDAGDIGIGRPGMASWSPEAQTILSDLLKLR